jgi:hypothetical protein
VNAVRYRASGLLEKQGTTARLGRHLSLDLAAKALAEGLLHQVLLACGIFDASERWLNPSVRGVIGMASES